MVYKSYGTETEVTLKVLQYQTGNMCVELYDKDGIPDTRLTVNVPEYSKVDGMLACIDTNNNPGAIEFLQENNLISMQVGVAHSGYCEYPIVLFNAEELMKADPDNRILIEFLQTIQTIPLEDLEPYNPDMEGYDPGEK